MVSGLADGPRPTGAVRFLACGPLTSDSGCAAGSGIPIGSGPVALTSGSGQTAVARSATFLAPRPGIWCLRAEYLGDDNYHASSDGGTGECVKVAAPPPPSIDLARPQAGHRYPFDATVEAHFSCHDGSGGPGIASCTGTVADGSAINTHRSGRHTFVVTATSADGEHTTTTVHYTVAPDNRVEISNVRGARDGTITLSVTVPGAGSLDTLVTAWKNNLAAVAALQPAKYRFAFARGHATASRAGTLHLTITPGRRGRRLVAHHTYRIVLRLWVRFTPNGGADSHRRRSRTPPRPLVGSLRHGVRLTAR